MGAPAGFPRGVRGVAFCIRPGDENGDENERERGNEGSRPRPRPRPRPRGYDLDVVLGDSESGREATATGASAAAGDGWRCVDARLGGDALELVEDARWDTLTWRDKGAGSVFYLRDVELRVDPGTVFPGEEDPKDGG